MGMGLRIVDLLLALPELSWGWLVLLVPRSVDQRQELLCPIATAKPHRARAPPNPRAMRLGPRAFSISLVNSLGGGFVCHHQLRKQTSLSPSTNGCCAD